MARPRKPQTTKEQKAKPAKSTKPSKPKPQDADLIFALDIGTRSIIGLVGRVENDRLHVLAIEKEEHGKRAMLDGQIEDIAQVAKVARQVTQRLEKKLGYSLKRVCVAAAGRALRTEKGYHSIQLPETTRVTSELISQLESGAVSAAEEALSHGADAQRRFYLVGYTVAGYQLDHYPLTTLKDHNGQLLEANVVATFLPSEVVESLYAVMEAAKLEVASLTLEPIAALNAVIPADLRLLNLVLADIGAGTSDIAVCRDGAVVGYTMATIAGDEITEELMRHYLVDFTTAERMKAQLDSSTVVYRDVLGLEQTTTGTDLQKTIEPSAQALAQEIARHVLALNGGSPSAIFLAGGGSKLRGLLERVAGALEMDQRRAALAGNNYEKSAFSKNYDLNDPELATPLGIAISAGLGLISDSYRIMLNGKPAKLFRSGALTVLELLMMNGYTTIDLLGRTGKNLSVTIDGERMVFRGEPSTPCVLTLNDKPVNPSAVVYAGDNIHFVPAVCGANAQRTVAEVVGDEFPNGVLVNGVPVPVTTSLNSGDEIRLAPVSTPASPVVENVPEPLPVPEEGEDTVEVAAPAVAAPAFSQPVELEPIVVELSPQPQEEETPPQSAALRPKTVLPIHLNGQLLMLEEKEDGTPYYLMDLLDRSGIDFEHLDRTVELRINGIESPFSQVLFPNDDVIIR